MKNIKDLREQYNLITEKEEHDMNKLTQLVRAGLFDAKKLSALKRAMDKPADKMTAQEKRMMINLLDALMSEVLTDKQVYRKIKQDVMKEETKDYYAKPDPRVNRGWPNAKDIPSVLILKRKAIRVFPDGEKVALYYAQAIDKYVSIPFSEINVNESVAGAILRGVGRMAINALSGSSNNSTSSSSSDSKSETDPIAKELKPLEKEKTKLNVSSDFKGREPYRTGVDANMERLARNANIEMAKGVRESFRNKLQSLNEQEEPGWQPKKTSIGDLALKKLRQAKATAKQWKAGSEAAKKGQTITKRERLPTEKIKDTMVDFYGGTKDAVSRVDRITKVASAASMGTTDIAGSALDTGALARQGKYKEAGKEFGLGVVAPLAAGAVLGKISGKVAREAEKAVSTRAAKDFDIATPKSGVEVPKGLKDITPTASASKGIEKSPKLYEPPKTTSKVPKPAQTAAERKTKYSMDLEVQRETNRRASEAMRKASEFRAKYPKSKDTTAATPKFDAIERSAAAKTATKSTFEPPKVKVNKGELAPKFDAAERSAAAKVRTKEPDLVKMEPLKPATSKGELVPVKEPSAAPAPAKPKATTIKKSTLSYGKTPEPKTTSTTNKEIKPAEEPGTSAQYRKNTQDQTQTQTRSKREKPGKDKVKTKQKEPGKIRDGVMLPSLGGALAAGNVDAKPISALKGGLKLNVSAPKREGEADAIRSRMSSMERKAWQSQAAMKESIDLDGNQFVLNNKEAKKVLSLYESLNDKNKKKMIKMMNESAEQLNKIISFAVRQ